MSLPIEVTEVFRVMSPDGGQCFHGNVNTVSAKDQILQHEMMRMRKKRSWKSGVPTERRRGFNEGRECVFVSFRPCGGVLARPHIGTELQRIV